MREQLSYRPSVIVYTIVIRAYGQVGKVKLAEQTFLEMLEVGCEPDEVACGTMLCTYARWGRNKAMVSFYSAVEERGVNLTTTVFNFMLSSLQKKSLHQDVLYMWRQMTDKKVAPNHFTYTIVIGSLVKSGEASEAFKTFTKMKNLGLVPEEATYSLLISLNSKSGNCEDAFWLYEDMRSLGIIPSNYTCASLLTLYYKDGDYSKALSLFSEMETYGIAADEVIYGLLIRIYGKLGLYEDAERTFREIENLGLLKDDKTYTTMAQVHLNSRDIDKALITIEQMKSRNILLSRFAHIILLRCYSVKGDVAAAEVTFQALSRTGLPDCSSCNDMLNLYVKFCLTEKAKNFVLHIRKAQVEFDEELVKSVMKLYSKEGMRREAEQLVEGLKAVKRLEDSVFFQSLVLAIQGKGNSGLLDQHGASELALILCLSERDGKGTEERLKGLLVAPNGLSVASQLISKLAREGELLKAEYLYEMLIKLGSRPDAATCASLITSYATQQNLEQAKKLFMAVVHSSSNRKLLWSSMFEACNKLGKEEEAYMLYKEEVEKGNELGPVAISMLVNALTKCGRHREAEDIVYDSFRLKAELDTVAYNTFIKAMLQAGKLHLAVKIYERMLSFEVAPSIQTYNTMISVYGRCRNLDKALEMFTTARSTGMQMDEKAYSNLICYYGKAGNVYFGNSK
ncbi:hypothetical protein Leryth_004635 [Lithospermum erythrorhizon]|nr:hypothetical protein Leryth_004635 [Lithospermum erythrorhizon]